MQALIERMNALMQRILFLRVVGATVANGRRSGPVCLSPLCGLQFVGSSQQLFQLTFDGGVADFFVLDDSIGVNRKCVRDGMDVELFRQSVH